MKERSYLKLKLVLSIILLILVLGFISVFFFFPKTGVRLPFFNGLIYNSSFNGEEVIIDNTYTFTDINEVSLTGASIDFEIKEHADNTISFTFSSSTSSAQFKQDGTTLYFEEHIPRFFNFNSGGTLTMYVPIDSSIDYEIDNVAGTVLMENSFSNEIDIESVSGDIEIKSISNNLDVDNVSGNIYSYSPSLEYDADTVSGNMYFTINSKTHSIDIDSVSGSLTINAIEEVSFDVNINSVSGSLHSNQENFNTTTESKNKINFNSVSGDIITEEF